MIFQHPSKYPGLPKPLMGSAVRWTRACVVPASPLIAPEGLLMSHRVAEPLGEGLQ